MFFTQTNRPLPDRKTRHLPEWRRRVRVAAPVIERQGINPFTVLRNLKKMRLEVVPGLATAGYTVIDHGAGLFILEVCSGLLPDESTRTEYHELAHAICVAHGRGAGHHAAWCEIVAALGFPEEAEREWPDVV